MTVTAYWDAVMNPERNPLSKLPKIVRFQLMTVLGVDVFHYPLKFRLNIRDIVGMDKTPEIFLR